MSAFVRRFFVLGLSALHSAYGGISVHTSATPFDLTDPRQAAPFRSRSSYTAFVRVIYI